MYSYVERCQKMVKLMSDFEKEFSSYQQRSEGWYELIKTTFGGSEMSALLGESPYKNVDDLIEEKVKKRLGHDVSFSNPACWWGTLFESVITAYVEIDLDEKVYGDNSCIQKYPGHRTSPDGYIIVNITKNNEIWQSNQPRDDIVTTAIALIEFKCPVTAKPPKTCPKHYKPQILSGLALSPMAAFGLYIGASFRRCPYNSLGCNSTYLVSATLKIDPYKDKLPVAWGVIAVYDVLTDDSDINFIQDFGGYCYDFNQTLETINNKEYDVIKFAPTFADGRGEVVPTIEEMKQASPKNRHLVGYLPWKLFHVTYATVQRDEKFLDVVLPKIAEVNKCVDEALSQDDPLDYLRFLELQKKQGDQYDLVMDIAASANDIDVD